MTNPNPGHIIGSMKPRATDATVCSTELHIGTIRHIGTCSKRLEGHYLAHYECDSCKRVIHYFCPLFAPMRSIHFNSVDGLSDVEVLSCENFAEDGPLDESKLSSISGAPTKTTKVIVHGACSDEILHSLPPFRINGYPENSSNK